MRDYDGDMLSTPIRVDGYQCMVQGDMLLLADVRRSTPVGITSRSVEEYSATGFPAHEILQGTHGFDLRILEIGPGLSEFVPLYAMLTSQKPVISETIDYTGVLALLNQVDGQLDMTEGAKDERARLIRRAQILASNKVVHVNPIPQNFSALGSGYDIILNLFNESMYESSMQEDELRSLLRAPRPGKEAISGFYFA